MGTALWRPMIGFEGYYEVSSSGDIRSLDREDLWGRTRKGKVISKSLHRCGYLRAYLSVGSKKKMEYFHRAVAKAFLPNPEEHHQVNHIDGNKTNNNLSNLEWCDNGYNQKHAVATGLRLPKVGKESPRYKSPVKVFDKDGTYLYSLHGNKEMADKGFDYRLVSAVVLGKRKTHKGHVFKR